jgi:membrane-associated phospholipid phosphatase
MVQLFADGTLLVILAAGIVAAAVWVVRTRPSLMSVGPYVIMAGLTSLLVGKLLSFWQPETLRPFMKQGVEAGAAYIDNPGFPSDHALLATIVVLSIYFLTPYKKTSYVLMALVGVMSVARVIALVHTPLDVIGGVLAGMAGVVWYVRYRQNEKHKN